MLSHAGREHICGEAHMLTGVHTGKRAGLVNESGNLGLTLRDMQSAPLANLFERMCAQPKRWLLGDFSCACEPSACPPRPHHHSSLSLSATTT